MRERMYERLAAWYSREASLMDKINQATKENNRIGHQCFHCDELICRLRKKLTKHRENFNKIVEKVKGE